MVQRATSLACDPSTSSTGRLLEEAFRQIRAELEVRQDFPADALAEVASSVAAPDLPERDETALELVTIDPPGSMDLDQAMHIARDGEGYRVRDVGSLNGTYVNRQRIESVALNAGDEVQVGKYRLTYHPSPSRVRETGERPQ